MVLWLSSCVLITADDLAARQEVEPTDTVDPSQLDTDGDGFTAELDCDDTDPRVFPGAEELPNQIDDDCDGVRDEGTIFFDDDGDGFCEELPCEAVCGLSDCSGDCDDTQAVVYPGAPELCDGLSNDCNWEGDEFDDRDGDGWSIAEGDPDDLNVADQPTEITTHYAAISCRAVRVAAGTYTRGCEDPYCRLADGPEHEVTITYDFMIMETEMLRGPWNRLLGPKNWAFPDCGDTCPVTRVSWEEAFEMANSVNRFYGLPECSPNEIPTTCEGWRLPTEAEWAWAARSNSSDRYAGGTNASLVGWIAENSEDSVHPARLKLPNEHGIYDMTGNVWEWVWDQTAAYPFIPVTDPVVLLGDDIDTAEHRRLRGASARTPLYDAYLAHRINALPYEGLFADTGTAADLSPTDPFNYWGFRLVRKAP